MKNIIISVLCLIALTASAQTPQDQEVWNNVEALNTAVFVSKDPLVLSRLVSENLSYGHSNGNLENKAEMASNAASNKATYRDIVTEKLGVSITGNTAIARHLFNATQTDKDGKESLLRIGILQVWLKSGNQWTLAARQAVRVAAK